MSQNQPADEAVPFFNDGVEFSSFTVPDQVEIGADINISGIIFFDCPVCVTPRGTRVRAITRTEEAIAEVGQLSNGQTGNFSLTLTAPSTPQTFTVRLEGQRSDPLSGNWLTDSSMTFDISITDPDGGNGGGNGDGNGDGNGGGNGGNGGQPDEGISQDTLIGLGIIGAGLGGFFLLDN